MTANSDAGRPVRAEEDRATKHDQAVTEAVAETRTELAGTDTRGVGTPTMTVVRPAPSQQGARRRLRALMARGWSPAAVERTSGIPATALTRVLASRNSVSPAVAHAVNRAYDQLWDREPPRATDEDRVAATAARVHARRCGWAPPMAWDDDQIDLPDGRPAENWKPGKGIVRRAVDLAEDAEWVRQHGGYRQASIREVALRLGVTKAQLDKALRRANRPTFRCVDAQAEPEAG
jgi:transcriptional regulator with XRE-family HTH domain